MQSGVPSLCKSPCILMVFTMVCTLQHGVTDGAHDAERCTFALQEPPHTYGVHNGVPNGVHVAGQCISTLQQPLYTNGEYNDEHDAAWCAKWSARCRAGGVHNGTHIAGQCAQWHAQCRAVRMARSWTANPRNSSSSSSSSSSSNHSGSDHTSVCAGIKLSCPLDHIMSINGVPEKLVLLTVTLLIEQFLTESTLTAMLLTATLLSESVLTHDRFISFLNPPQYHTSQQKQMALAKGPKGASSPSDELGPLMSFRPPPTRFLLEAPTYLGYMPIAGCRRLIMWP
eukprot:100908-Pelagomonas_calceolata.AAC.2